MSAYIPREESKEAVQVAFVLGLFVGGFLMAIASAVMAGGGL